MLSPTLAANSLCSLSLSLTFCRRCRRSQWQLHWLDCRCGPIIPLASCKRQRCLDRRCRSRRRRVLQVRARLTCLRLVRCESFNTNTESNRVLQVPVCVEQFSIISIFSTIFRFVNFFFLPFFFCIFLINKKRRQFEMLAK